jgi:general secretion pathway protein D
VIGRAITLGGVTFPSIGAFVRAVRGDTDFKVISTPQLLTLDNEEAVIEVGQNLPFVTRVDSGTSTTDRAIQSFEYRDVGVSLKVTPQINQSRFVRLKVEESIKTVLSESVTSGDETILAPTTAFRTAKTTITVSDGETAVIGGLIEDNASRTKTMTPCIGNLPILGWAFKSISDKDSRTNLMVFLTPHIVENPDEGRTLYEQKKGRIEEEADKAIKAGQSEVIRQWGYK